MAAKVDPIHFHFLVSPFYFPRRGCIKQFIADRFRLERVKIERLNYVFCDDDYLLRLNQQYLQHDTYTDIITFELSDPGQPALADIYISIPRVKENAAAYNTTFRKELYRVIFHGALHLLGYKDKTGKQAAEMRELENRWLAAHAVSCSTVSGRNR